MSAEQMEEPHHTFINILGNILIKLKVQGQHFVLDQSSWTIRAITIFSNGLGAWEQRSSPSIIYVASPTNGLRHAFDHFGLDPFWSIVICMQFVRFREHVHWFRSLTFGLTHYFRLGTTILSEWQWMKCTWIKNYNIECRYHMLC